MKVIAVIVTFNRLELLQRCVQSIRNQDRKPDEIVIINNGSTDKTLDWLNSQSDIFFITQENTGSGGGQNTGIRIAYERGADWIWTMDDDGYAIENTLSNLLSHTYLNNLSILNSFILIENSQDIAFPFVYKYSTPEQRVLYRIEDFDYFPKDIRVLEGAPWLFNSSLIARDVITLIGLPNPAFFIRGDEVEYFHRAFESGIKCYTVRDSIYFHPSGKNLFKVLGKEVNIENISGMKLYYQIRNHLYIRNRYKKGSLIKRLGGDFIIKEIILLLTFQKSIKQSFKDFKLLAKGIKDRNFLR